MFAVAFLAPACAYDRPIHPLRLEGFPGAPVEGDLFPLRDGRRWTFEDRLDPERAPLVLALARDGGGWRLRGAREGGAGVRIADGFLEIHEDGAILDRPLRLTGRVGDTWEVGDAVCTVFGWDEVEVLGAPRRALVVAVERDDIRDLYWFADGLGWVRLRTEYRGAPKRDARLVAFEPGVQN